MEEDKVICLSCGYETERWKVLEHRKKGEFPLCPTCHKELSFKDSALLAESQHPAVPYIIIFIVLLIGALGILGVNYYFKSFDGRRLVMTRAVPGDWVYGGKTKARIPGEWVRMPYSYEKYWNARFRSRIDTMFKEEHWYRYEGAQDNGIQIGYRYEDSSGKKGKHFLRVPLSNGKGILKIPAIPYVESSKPAQIGIRLGPDQSILLEEI